MKIIKIFVINLLIILVVMLSCDFICSLPGYKHYLKYYNRVYISETENKLCLYYKKLKFYIKEYASYWIGTYEYRLKGFHGDKVAELSEGYINSSMFRPINFSEEFVKPAIILMGCSFTYGENISNEDAFHSVLSDYSKHLVINLGQCSTSPREMLYILTHKDLLKYLTKNIEEVNYVIYTYIPDHLNRLFIEQWLISPYYQLTNDRKTLQYKKKNRLLVSTFIYKNWADMVRLKFPSMKKKAELFNIYMSEIQREVTNNYKDAKFIVLVYNDDGIINWQKIKEKGIIVIKLSDIVSENLNSIKYQVSQQDVHPNALAWKVIVPELVKKLNL